MIPLMLVGVFHFASARDYVDVDPGDIGSPARQAELAAIAADLAGFRPTKVVVERAYADRDQVAADYRAVRDGHRERANDETEQLGFRIAACRALDAVHAIDVMHRFAEPDLDVLLRHDASATLVMNGLTSRARAASSATEVALASSGIRAALAFENAPAARRETLAVYTDDCVRLVSDDTYTGADMVGNWYHRNIRIFANLRRCSAPDDRLLVLYGAGHIPVLAHLAESSGVYDLVDPLQYLMP